MHATNDTVQAHRTVALRAIYELQDRIIAGVEEYAKVAQDPTETPEARVLASACSAPDGWNGTLLVTEFVERYRRDEGLYEV